MNETAPAFHGLLETEVFLGKEARDFLATGPLGTKVEASESNVHGTTHVFAGSLRENQVSDHDVQWKIRPLPKALAQRVISLGNEA